MINYLHTLKAGAGYSSVPVMLKVVECQEENAYEPILLAHDKPVTINVEKGAWFQIGIALDNTSDVPIAASVIVENVEVRIANTNSWAMAAHFWFYVNSWGRAKIESLSDRVGAQAPARSLCITEENSFSEIRKVTHTEANALQHFCLVVAAFNKSVCPWHIHGIKYLMKPVMVRFGTVISPVNLAYNVISVGNDHSIWETCLCNPSEMRIHITNKVRYIRFTGEL